MKVIFCNTAYMKYYCGTDGDTPRNGGKYVNENNTGGEAYNFLDDNGKCYGYFMSYGQTHIERLEGVDARDEEVSDVLVVWTAKRDASSPPTIVGWYKNATVYRQFRYKGAYGIGVEHNYCIVADSKDCYLLPEEKRRFAIPRAPVAGAGKGMGQSAIWYAESSYAQTEFIPRVIEYIENYERDCGEYLNFVYTEEELNKKYMGDKSMDELVELAANVETPLDDALAYINTALESNETAENLCIKADILSDMLQFSLAQKYFEKAFETDSSMMKCQARLHQIYMVTGQYDKAALTGKMLENTEFFTQLSDNDKWTLYAYTTDALISINKLPAASEYVEKLKKLKENNSLDERQNEGLDMDIKYFEDMLEQ